MHLKTQGNFILIVVYYVGMWRITCIVFAFTEFIIPGIICYYLTDLEFMSVYK